jgi:hypothetical protein
MSEDFWYPYSRHYDTTRGRWAMPQAAKKTFEVSLIHYEGLCAPPPVLPTQEELFDYQIEKLVSAGHAKYEHADAFRNRIPEKGLFLIVPPPPKKLDLKGLMANVELDGRAGVNYLDVNYLADIGEYPATASLLTDVEDGRGRLNTKPMVSRENIASELRHLYNTWRGIIHITVFPWVLKHHYLDLVGSRCDEGGVPGLYVSDDKPALINYWEGNADPIWGAPSAGSVIVP